MTASSNHKEEDPDVVQSSGFITRCSLHFAVREAAKAPGRWKRAHVSIIAANRVFMSILQFVRAYEEVD